MKKQWLIMGLLIMSVLAFTACGKKQEEADPGRVYRRDGSDRQLAG